MAIISFTIYRPIRPNTHFEYQTLHLPEIRSLWRVNSTEKQVHLNGIQNTKSTFTVTSRSYAPTASASGRKPSLRLRSSRLISSIDVADAIAARTLSASSFDMSRPAFAAADGARGSSVDTICFGACEETVVESVVPSALSRPSSVRKRAVDVLRSYTRTHEPSSQTRERRARRTLSRMRWKSKTLSPGNRQASHSRYHFFSRTGLPSKERYLRLRSARRGSRSPSSANELLVRTSVVRFGTER
jgi:hypothetical protein